MEQGQQLELEGLTIGAPAAEEIWVDATSEPPGERLLSVWAGASGTSMGPRADALEAWRGVNQTLSVKRLQKEWDELATLDPLWAVLSYRSKKFGRWDRREFFEEGDRDAHHLLEHAQGLGYPKRWETVLDFGCGIGRLAPALSAQFKSYLGVDISSRMVSLAREVHSSRPNCNFTVSSDETLERLPDASFDLIVSLLVLQHVPERTIIASYVHSFIRLLRPGGLLVFQHPERVRPLEKLLHGIRRGLYSRLRAVRVPKAFIFRYLRLFPMTMNPIPERDVTRLLEEAGARLVDVERRRPQLGAQDRTYYATTSW